MAIHQIRALTVNGSHFFIARWECPKWSWWRGGGGVEAGGSAGGKLYSACLPTPVSVTAPKWSVCRRWGHGKGGTGVEEASQSAGGCGPDPGVRIGQVCNCCQWLDY